MAKVRIIYVDSKLAKLYEEADREFIRNPRPCLLVVRLKFREKYQDFAIPIRSNINPRTAHGYYFALPPRPKTRPDRIHGLQYTKMFPVAGIFLTPYKFTNWQDELRIKNTISKNLSQIVSESQAYLDGYQNGEIKVIQATNIDVLMEILQEALKTK